ncbi:MAG: hypothetical protein PHN44_01215 [Candidatus Marinimicrobia bacterium]|nr:hypothetical protein [Candidatus Neomarinimicrobiota bacterium]MDD5539086.1 hypothetical protein [Candidatus Neomarinimicrobiota bacterium]
MKSEDIVRLIPFDIEIENPNPENWERYRNLEFTIFYPKPPPGKIIFTSDPPGKLLLTNDLADDPFGWTCIGLRRFDELELLMLVKKGKMLQYASSKLCRVTTVPGK